VKLVERGIGVDSLAAMMLTVRSTGMKDAWRLDASCRYTDPDLFFPTGRGVEALATIEAAKTVCRSCPVRRPCLNFAVETGQSGVWGGTSEEERRRSRPL